MTRCTLTVLTGKWGRTHPSGGSISIAAPTRGTEDHMSSRGTSFGLTARTRKSLVFFWTALFVVSMALQYASAAAPQAALAAAGDPIIVPDPTPNGCNGVLPTPGSENTLKRL